MNKTNNQRSQETNRNIIQAVYEIISIEKRPLNKITVREVCERAHVHRSTFYTHYMDVYDLVEKVEKTMSVNLTESFLQKMEEGASAVDCYENLFEFIKEHREFYRIYLNDTQNTGAISLATELYQDRLDQMNFKEIGYTSQREFVYHQQFFLYGVTAMIRLWVKDDCPESPKEFVQILLRESDTQKAMTTWNWKLPQNA